MKSIKRNFVFNLIDNIVTILSPLITAPYIARVIGAFGVGKISFAESVMTIFLIGAGFGVNIYGEREISYVQDNKYKRSCVFWNVFLLKALIVPVFLAAYLIYTKKLNDTLALYLSLHIVAEIFAVNWFYMGIEEFGFLVLRSLIIRILQVIYIFVFVKTSSDVLVYAMASVFAVILTNLSSFAYLFKYLNKVRIKDLSPFKGFVPSLLLFLPTIASLIYSVVDKAMLGWITDNSYQNGYYEQAYNISHMVLALIVSISSVMVPRIGFEFKKKNNEQLNNLMYKGFGYIFMLGLPLSLGMALVSANFVPWFFGDGWLPVVNLLIVFSPICLIVGLSTMSGKQFLVYTQRENLYTVSVFAGAIINILLNLFMIKRWNALGAAIASVIAETLVLVLDFIFIRKDLSIKKIIKDSLKYLFASVIMGLILFILSKRLNSSIVNTFIMVLSGIFVYFTVLFLIKDSLFLEDFKNITAKIRGKKNEH